ncbi:MAG: tRNA (cytidine(34)-2'-O)-methyltransferase [Candidatus Dadabacteria bacterium]|nr:MAG: tRNA (cytidine(34)-2'-O)-methyltransferase [Candidatus Dadabacteria bacterium]
MTLLSSLQVVLVEPDIPQNTGSIARTCAAIGAKLHLVGKLGFDISDKAVRRAGLDYWQYVEVYHHKSWQAYIEEAKPCELWFFSTKGEIPFWEASISQSASLVFGSETRGLGDEFLSKQDKSRILTLPILNKGVRSLNLSNCVTAAVYQVVKRYYRRVSTSEG